MFKFRKRMLVIVAASRHRVLITVNIHFCRGFGKSGNRFPRRHGIMSPATARRTTNTICTVTRRSTEIELRLC